MNDSLEKVESLKVMAHPVRVMILEELSKGIKCVGDLGGFLEIRQPNVSQHLSLLRRSGIIDYYMEGRQRCYFLKDPFALDLLSLLRKEYNETLPPPACCPVRR